MTAPAAVPSGVCVTGLVAWSMSINGEYIRTNETQDGSAVYQKPDGSKVLSYKASRRSWLIQRSLKGGLYAVCRQESTYPTDIDTCTVGVHTGRAVQVHPVELPRTLLVSGKIARKLALDGEFCLQTVHSESTQATPIFRLATGDCTLGADGTVWLEHQEGSWEFIQRSPSASSTLASCATSFLRPDRLPFGCFGFSISASRAVPLTLEVLGPANSPASHVRGEYQRVHNEANRASYEKLGGSMRLFYSYDLGGWQLSTSSTGALAQQPEACACSPEQPSTAWQVLNDQGQWQEVPLTLKSKPLPPSISWSLGTAWPWQLLAGDYNLLSGLDSFGRPTYALYMHTSELAPFCLRSLLPCSSGTWALVSFTASRWQVSVNGQVVAAAASRSAAMGLPTGANHWHIIGRKRCVPVAAFQLEEWKVPFVLLISGWEGVVNTAVNGEYRRSLEGDAAASRRPSYQKADGSAHLWYNEAAALWIISRGAGTSPGPALATCGQAQVRDPSHLPSNCWRIGSSNAQLQLVSLEPSMLQVDGNTSCDGEFHYAGLRHQRPTYRQKGVREPCWLFYDSAVSLWTMGVQQSAAQQPLFRAAEAWPPAAEDWRGWKWTALDGAVTSVSNATFSLQLRLARARGAVHIHVKSRHDAAKVLDGLYLRGADLERRPAYHRTEGEAIVLRFSNTNGDWRFVTATAPPKLIAFSAEVQRLRPEEVTTWRIPKGGSLYSTKVILSMTAKVCSCRCSPMVLLLAAWLAWIT